MAKKKASAKKESTVEQLVTIEPATTPAGHRKNIVKLIHAAARRSDPRRVFADFVEMASLSVSNAVDKHHFDEREHRYMEIVKAYQPEEIALFPRMLAELTMALEEPHDALGILYGELEVSNKYAGQFFTPYELCRMMARMIIDDELRRKIDTTGYITMQEPACGAGANIIAMAQEMRDAGINYQQALHVTAIDIDPKCAHMCYLQLSLLHIPAVVYHGNTLSLGMHSTWKTPAHIMGGWWYRLKPAPVDDQILEMPLPKGPIEVDLSDGLPGAA